MWIPFADESAFKRYQERLSPRSVDYVKALSTFLDGARGIGFVDFFLQSVNETYQEKVQVSEVLSDGYIAHFFGQRAPVWGYSGVLLNTRQDEWYDIWHILYEDVLRGTRLSEARLPVRLAYDTRVVSGSLMNMSTGLSAQNETFATLQFQLLVRDVKYSPTQLATTTQLRADNLGSDRFLSPDQLVTSLYAGLDLARADFREEESLKNDIRVGADPVEVKEKTGLDIQQSTEATEQNQSLLEEEQLFTSADATPVQGSGMETAAAPAYQQAIQ